jgi:serine/threonine protein kinase/ligand-binding sensor domain-containing protein
MRQYIGMRLGAYQIVEQIGQGGMATVFQAYQPSIDRYVAIKILPSRFTEDESFVGRFTQEARTLARLEHPHILPVYDYGEQEGITYLVMRYVEAGTLKDLAREGPLELEEAGRILGQVGAALDYAHSQDVVHRDIKPSNVLIDRRGNTFLTDFGIAKLVAETAQFTASGAIIGTPAYMSPEQGMGKPVDYRCDIYSLGVVLYELVTGQVPFEAETPLAVLLQHVNDPLPPPRQIEPDLPAAVERVILKAMAKAPDDRFQSAQEMTDALAKAVVRRPTVTIPPPPVTPGEATTLVRGRGAPPAPAADAAPPPPAAGTTPPPVADTPTPPPIAHTATPLPATGTASLHPALDSASLAPFAGTSTPPPIADASPPRLETGARARSPKPWLLFTGGALLLGLLLAVGLFVVSNLIDGEPIPTEVSQVKTTTVAASQAQDTPTAESQLAALPPSTEPEQVQPSSGWTNYGNGNFVFALARQEDTLWAGGESGLVRWDLTDGSYSKLGKADGLASVRINDLLVDEAGVLWIATDAGINRYDGKTMITYDEADALDSSNVQALFLDEAGGLWAGSRGGERGLSYYDGEGWGPPPVPPLPIEYPNVQALGGNEADGLFVGLDGHGLALFDDEAWSVLTSADGLPSDEVITALLTDDALWITFDQALVQLDLETGDRDLIPQHGIDTIHQTADGHVWFGGQSRALRFNPVTGDWQEFDTTPDGIPDRVVTDIMEDEDGLWFSTYGGGVVFYDGSRWETWTTDEDLGGNWIEAIRQDKDGALWFTHPGTGLSRYEPDRDTWQIFGESEGALDWPSIPGVDSEGNLWIGETGGLVRYDGQAWESFTSPELADVGIYAIEIGPDDVKWLITDGGLIRHNPITDEWTTFTGADQAIIEDIWSILASSDGTLWLGGEEGLVQYDGSTWSTPVASGGAPQFVDDLAEAPDGTLWIAADGRLGHLADGRWSYSAWPSEGWLERTAVGPDGSVWAGYEGLGRYDPAGGNWQLFTPDDGLAHFLVRAIHVTPEGVVWVGTEGGVSRFVPPE